MRRLTYIANNLEEVKKMQEFTAKDFIRIFRKWWMLLTVLPLIVALLVSYYNYNYLDDIYMSRSCLFLMLDYIDNVGNRRIDMALSRDLTANLKELFNRSYILQRTAEALEMPNLSSLVSIRFTHVLDTSIFEISAVGTDPRLCAEAANAAAEVIAEYANEVIQKDSTRITQYAGVSRTPIGPQRTQNILLSTAVALLASISGAILIEMINQRIKSESQVEEGLQLSVLGSIPDYRSRIKAYEREKHLPSHGLMYYLSELDNESFKTLATNISFVIANPTIKTIVLTSAVADDGMNAFVLLTADAFAETGKRVLIVDMDYHNQSLSEYIKIQPSSDLVDYLAGRSDISSVIVPTNIYNVSFVGNYHSTGLFSRVIESANFSEFLASVESAFDIVLFSTPSLDLYIDAAVLASKAGGTVLIIPSNRIDAKHARMALERLKRGGATILGAVLNYTKPEKANAYYKKSHKGLHKKRDKALGSPERKLT